ncbi:MAG: zf-HC2 domain-containing protein [Candidatus Krumholzibacteriota bacterium]|nr:zf-HC2 domain-containing protein [Candidatus Krumholzibacteriota bacterium]
MNVRDDRGHPGLDALADLLDGGLGAEERASVETHVESCAICRLELAGLRRFRSIDGDGELLEEANWPAAERALADAFRERIFPAVPGRAREPRILRFTRLLAPLAAAAAILLVFAGIETTRIAVFEGPSRGPMRGTAGSRSIALLAPSGDVGAPPDSFSWAPSTGADRYELDIFGTDLRLVFHAGDLAGPAFALPDSVAALFAPGEIYLWSVKAYTGLERSAASPNGWFRVRAR